MTDLVLRKLTPATLWRLSTIEREPLASPWAVDVERILLDGAGASHLAEPGSALLAADQTGRIIGAALNYNHEQLIGVQYIAAMLVDHRYRGDGLGRQLLAATIADARTLSGRAYVAWAVDPANEAMIALSTKVATRFGQDRATGLVQFVDP
jgi:GNAT superfamily N-acetyltransferase